MIVDSWDERFGASPAARQLWNNKLDNPDHCAPRRCARLCSMLLRDSAITVISFVMQSRSQKIAARPPVLRSCTWGGASVITTHMNDDQSRLLDLITCIDCKQTMKIEESDSDDAGKELLRYQCAQCGVSKLHGYRVS